MRKLALSLFVALLFLQPASGWAEFYQLFIGPGVQSPGYEAMITALAPGDEIGFSDGRRLRIEKVLGRGNTSLILAVEGLDGRAVRIPLKAGHWDKKTTYVDFIDSFLKGHLELRQLEAPVLEVFHDESLAKELVVVERLNIHFDYGQWLSGKVKLAPEVETRVRSDFVDFARRTWGFAIVGDMHTGQIVYTDKGWLFMDFDARNKQAGKVSSGTIFTKGTDEMMAERYHMQAGNGIIETIDKLPTPRKLHTQIMAAIEAERLARGLEPPLLTTCAKWLKEKWVGLTGKKKSPP